MFAQLGQGSVLALLALSACSATTGRGWVNEPEDGNAGASVPAREFEASAAPLALAPTLTDDAEPARPRLSRVVSLGQSEIDPARPATPLGAAAPPGVVVNIVNYGSNPYTAGYGYPTTYRSVGSSSYGTFAPSVSSSTGTPGLGGDWARAPSYGPTFPYHTAPASPWERSRR
ncbi:MAG: hypothetical protein QM756_05985 [Polyangiaceae bacterium]